MTTDIEFQYLLAACDELCAAFPEGIVFIGGIAVYMHAINGTATNELAEMTHDGDFYISIADMSDLRDIEEVTQNRRLSKHQLVKAGFEFDIYTERHSALLTPYSEVIAHSVKYGGLRVAGLAHLFVLKLEAYRDRIGSTKGQKDAKDLIRISAIAAAGTLSLDLGLTAPYIRDEHLSLLDRVQRGPEFTALARGNAMMAKKLRTSFSQYVSDLKGHLEGKGQAGHEKKKPKA